MGQKLRIGMIGCGEIAYKASGKAIGDARNAEIVMAMDPVAEVAASFGQTFGVPHTTELDEVLEHSEVDAVVISAPHYLHEPLTVQAASAGKHVMCEKPIACTLEQADRMIAACKEAGVLLGINLVSRYAASTVKAKELVSAGVIGEVVGMQFHVMADKQDSYWTGGYSGRVQTEWRKSREQSGGGVLVMNLVHDIDRFRYITGLEAVRVFCEYDTYCTRVEVEDSITAVFRYDNGAIGTATASSCARGRRGNGNRIVGTEGQILFPAGETMEVFTSRGERGLQAGEWNSLSLQGEEPRRVYTERFAEAVFESRQPDIPGEEGRKTLETIVAAYRSGETHQPVGLPL
ncbi:MAG: Gfo/Idh/MocA family oxidoreductase [bacterium]|nr:Gfo/Idh/MocA family oxidoreductase [bacterium]